MTDTRPSAFIDSPEDLVRKANVLLASGRLSPADTLLVSDVVRELSKSREGHARRMSMVTAAASETSDLRSQIASYRRTSRIVSVLLALSVLSDVVLLVTGHR